VALRPPPPRTQAGRAMELGLQIALSVVLGVGLGYYADRKFGTKPIFLFIFLVVGFATAIRIIIQFVNSTMPRPDIDKSKDEKREGPGA
jgi:ATP synthase protein I